MKIIHPTTEFWIETKLDKPMMDYVWSQIKLAKTDIKHELVGHITKSLDLPDTENKLSLYVIEVAKKITNIYQPHMTVKTLWVNFQNKYEFNPLHSHNSALSFVLFVQIPYKYEDERKTVQARNIDGPIRNGCFSFVYTSVLGQLTDYDYLLNDTFEGVLLVFPASLQHQVYPFYTSDLERISISGNIY
tara:strand:+ start:221 stop:787 length:567 start_codon:yes stop_codon:yes gene_type:complete